MRAHVICIVNSRTIRGVSWNLSQGGMLVEVSDLRQRMPSDCHFDYPFPVWQLRRSVPLSGEVISYMGSSL